MSIVGMGEENMVHTHTHKHTVEIYLTIKRRERKSKREGTSAFCDNMDRPWAVWIKQTHILVLPHCVQFWVPNLSSIIRPYANNVSRC